jgi:serine/threonine protein kinase
LRIGKYKILRKISSGGMGEVYLAREKGTAGLERLVAFKMILPHFTEDEEFVSMFLEEAKLTAQLSHQNIVKILEFDKFENTYFIAMEYVDGLTLADLIKECENSSKTIPINMALYIVIQICIALDYAHRKKSLNGTPLNIVHRDVTPKNVMISFEGEVKLMDFGIAKAASREYKTRTGTIKGKIMYLSPEQILGKPLDKRSDLFSLGTLFYELLTGQKLFQGDSDFSVMNEIQRRDVREDIIPDRRIPDNLKPVIFKLLEKDREKRYQTGADVQMVLEKFARDTFINMSYSSFSSYIQSLNLKEKTDRNVIIEAEEMISVSTNDFKKDIDGINISKESLPRNDTVDTSKVKSKSRTYLIVTFLIINIGIIGFLVYYIFSLNSKTIETRKIKQPGTVNTVASSSNIVESPKPTIKDGEGGKKDFQNSNYVPAVKKNNDVQDQKKTEKPLEVKAAVTPKIEKTIISTITATQQPKPKKRAAVFNCSESLGVYISKDDIVNRKAPIGFTNKNIDFGFGENHVYLFKMEPFIFKKVDFNVPEGDGQYSENVPSITMGMITVNVNPTNSIIRLDGVDIGYAPINNFKLNTGSHTFMIKCMAKNFDQKPFLTDIIITEGYNKEIMHKFEKSLTASDESN